MFEKWSDCFLTLSYRCWGWMEQRQRIRENGHQEQGEGNMLSVCSMVTNPRNMAELTMMNWKCGKLIRTNRKPSNNSVVYTFNDYLSWYNVGQIKNINDSGKTHKQAETLYNGWVFSKAKGEVGQLVAQTSGCSPKEDLCALEIPGN